MQQWQINKRERRLAAQEKSRSMREEHPDVGMTDEEFNESAKATGEVKVDAETLKQAQAFLRGENPFDAQDIGAWIQGIRALLRTSGGDPRTVTARKEIFKMVSDVMKQTSDGGPEDPLAENWEDWVAVTEQAFESRERGAEPQKLRALGVWDREHAEAVLKRETPEKEEGET